MNTDLQQEADALLEEAARLIESYADPQGWYYGRDTDINKWLSRYRYLQTWRIAETAVAISANAETPQPATGRPEERQRKISPKES